MAITRVSAHDGTGTTSAAFGGTPSAGDLLLCLAVATSANAITVAGFTQIVTENGGAGNTASLFAKSAAGTEGTITPSAGLGTIVYTGVCEYSGAANPYATDGTAGGSETTLATSLATASITTTQAADLIFTCCFSNAAMSSQSWTTATTILSSGAAFCGQYLPGVTESGYSDTAHFGFSNVGTLIAAFKAAAATNNGGFFLLNAL